jgi:hypothetical protein
MLGAAGLILAWFLTRRSSAAMAAAEPAAEPIAPEPPEPPEPIVESEQL